MSDDTDDHEVTRLLDAWAKERDEATFDRLWALIEDDLKTLARRAMRRERTNHTLQPTALINETYCKLHPNRTLSWQNRQQFFGTAIELMRKILISYARKRNAAKRGSGRQRVRYEDVFEYPAGKLGRELGEPVSGWWIKERPEEYLTLDDTVEALKKLNRDQGQVVELKFYFGLTGKEISEVVGRSPRQINRDWQVARRFLLHELDRQRDEEDGET